MLYVEVYQINVSFSSYCDYCSACEKSFLTGKERPRECTHCRSPHQKNYIYIYIFTRTVRKALCNITQKQSLCSELMSLRIEQNWKNWSKKIGKIGQTKPSFIPCV